MSAAGTENSSTVRTQRLYARLAGFLLLWLIFTYLTGAFTISRIVGSGTFTEQAKRVAASERLYRIALSTELIETLSVLLLAFALYATLKPIDERLAHLAMLWRLAESFVGCAGMIFGFAELGIYTSTQSSGGLSSQQGEALMTLTSHAGVATYNIAALSFSIGSLLFFYLFFKSRYIPRILSAVGVFASVIVTIICFGSLIVPEHAAKFKYGWAPMALAEVATGVWLMLFAVKTDGRAQPSAGLASLREGI